MAVAVFQTDYSRPNLDARDFALVFCRTGFQESCWKECIHFLNCSNNSYVCMFALTTIEVSLAGISGGILR